LEQKMTTRRTETPPSINLLPILAGLVVVCLVIAAILTALTRNSAPLAAPGEQLSLVVQRMPFEAQNALRGEASSFDALAKSAARLKSLRAAIPGTADATWSKRFASWRLNCCPSWAISAVRWACRSSKA
jgi:hypothetical protein